MKTINGAVLHGLVNSVYLNGIINEAVLTFKRGEAFIQAIDPSNSLFVSNVIDIETVDDMKLGISDLGLLTKILQGNEQVQYELSTKEDKQWMKFKLPQKGSIKLLLTDPEQISTAVENDEAGDNLLKDYKTALGLGKDVLAKLTYFIELLKPVSVLITIKKGVVYATSNQKSDKQFKVKLGKVEDAEDTSTEIYSEHLLSALKLVEEEAELDIKDKDNPILLIQENCIWAFSPISEE